MRISRTSSIVPSSRVVQLRGIFDIPESKTSDVSWDVVLPLSEKPWSVGLIVGPSGSGKSTIARDVFGDRMIGGYDWPKDRSIVDSFPQSISIKDVVAILSSVGFSSPPSWLRPFHVLSNGEQFRTTMARAIAESVPGVPFVVDEFTSVVDRTVARIGSSAIAKAVRARGSQFVAVSCHYDIAEWLCPDWIYDPSTGDFQWGLLRRRPAIPVEVARVRADAWSLFRRHHYLDAGLHRSAKCFVAFVEDRPACFAAVLPFPHPTSPGWRGHRTVCLPDFQGVGIGNALSELVAGMMIAATGKPYTSRTSHPAMIRYRNASPNWNTIELPKVRGTHQSRQTGLGRGSYGRITAGFRYIGPKRVAEAEQIGLMAECAHLR